ncbi:unnamed protein product, partial [Staurois parvus]
NSHCPSVLRCVSHVLFHGPSCIPGGRHLQCGHPAVTACGFTAGTHCTCASSTVLHEWSCSLLGPVMCPTRLQGGREDTFCFRSPRRLDRKWDRVPVKFEYPLPPPRPPNWGSST